MKELEKIYHDLIRADNLTDKQFTDSINYAISALKTLVDMGIIKEGEYNEYKE